MGRTQVSRRASTRYPLLLLGTYGAWWLALAVAPTYRQDWLLENALVFLALPLLIWSYRRLHLTNRAYTLLFVFFMLHALGAHYTYSEVPYDRWADVTTGGTVSSAFGFERNHYDRLVHLSYGLLVTPAAIELLDDRAPQSGPWRWILPVLFMASHSTIYEVVEWGAAELFGGELGQAYLGTQGDEWDSQKDSALALLGAAIAVTCVRFAQHVERNGIRHVWGADVPEYIPPRTGMSAYEVAIEAAENEGWPSEPSPGSSAVERTKP